MRLPDPNRSRVILLGSSEYEDAEHLPAIPAVRKTITDLQVAFTDPKHGIVPREHCTVLLDERDLPTIGRTVRAAMADAEDMLLVYFVGHGIVDGRHHLHLGIYHSDWENPGFNSLDYEQLRYAILEVPAATKVLILDCCFSGRALGEPMGDKVTSILGELDVDGTYVLTSAQRDEVALVLPGEDHTSFTGRMLRLLRDGIPGGPELLTIDDIYKQLQRIMKSESLSVPQRRATKTADLLALARNRAFGPSASETLRQRQAAALEQGKRGEWAAAMRELQDVFAECSRVLGDHDETTLRARQLLAQATGAAGDPAQAERLLTQVLDEQAKWLGIDHEDTLQSRQLLAVSVAEAGRRAEALTMLRVLLPDRRRVLGADHDAVMRTQHVLARYLAMTGAFDEAVALLREVLSSRQRMLGHEHSETERTRRDLEKIEKQRNHLIAISDRT
jgi:Tetratricopeptide repeat/Caspase domain